MLQGAYVFKSPRELSGLYDTLFGGLFIAKSVPALIQLGILGITLCLVGMAFMRRRVAFKTLVIINFALLCLLCVQPWDELFVNLRHAGNLALGNGFSFNRSALVEGTVDFLPYALLGLLHKIGLPLVEGALLLSFLGGLLCLFIGRKFLARFDKEMSDSWGFLLLSFFPPLLYNSSQGFTASLFTGVLLSSLYLILWTPRKNFGFALIALLPLIRIEGVWLIMLLLPRNWIRAGIALLPALALTAYRKITYGSFLPLPVQYKATFGNLFYSLIGVRNLASDLLAGYGLSAFLLIVVCSQLIPKSSRAEWRKTSWTTGVYLLAFVLPYYLSGGDWFPPHWERYLFPLSFALWIGAIGFSTRTWAASSEPLRAKLLAAAVLLVVIPGLWSQSGFRRLISDLFPPRKFLAKTLERHSAHARIQFLSQLGNHLNKTTPPSFIIGSSEVATIMFFAQRETLDLLGIANPEIVSQPLRTSPPLLRKYARSELPFSIFRRINPTLVPTKKPEILYLFDFSIRDLFVDLYPWEVTNELLPSAIRRWEKKFQGLVAPIYGSVDRLVEIGYKPVVVFAGQDFCNLYFVSETGLKEHLAELQQQGYDGGWVKF